MKKYWVLAGIIFIVIIMAAAAYFISGNLSSVKIDITGAWRLTALENFSTGDKHDFGEEILLFNRNRTGAEIYLPCDYNEEYSYITWKSNLSGTYLDIKHSDEYIYRLDIVEVSRSQMKCAFYFGREPDIHYLATYEKIPEGAFEYIGRWSIAEYYENEDPHNPNESYLNLYPNGSVDHVYYEVKDMITESGTWHLENGNLVIDLEMNDSKTFKSEVIGNTLNISQENENGEQTLSVYKRYYGLITNTPPQTYPQKFSNKIISYFSSLIKSYKVN